MLRQTLIVVVFAAVALAICACFAAVALPFSVVRGYLDALAGDGSAEPYTPQLHWRLRIYFACLGVAALLIGTWLIVDARSVGEGRSLLGRLSDDARQFSADLFGFLRTHAGAVIGLLLVGLLVRLPYVDQPIRYDEAHSFVNYANRPAYVTISTYKEPNNHVFHNLCVHVVTRIFGDAEWVIRLPALLAGVLTIPATYALGCLWAGRSLGWLAALSVVASSPLIGYSVNGRGYSILCLVTVCLVLLGHESLRRHNRSTWGAMTVLAAIGFWTVPTMLYPYAMVWVWLLVMHGLRSRSDSHEFPGFVGKLRILLGGRVSSEVDGPAATSGPSLRSRPGHPNVFRQNLVALFVHTVATIGLTLLLYSPIFIVEGPDAFLDNPLIAAPGWSEFLDRLPDALSESARLLFRDLPVPAVLLLGIGWLLALGPAQWKQNPAPSVLLLSSGVCALLVLIQHVLPFPRIWLFLVPLFLTVAICGVMSSVASRGPVLRAVALLTIVLLLVVWPLINLVRQDTIRQSREGAICPDAEAAVVWLKTGLLPREPIVTIVPSSAPMVYYAQRHGLSLEHFEWPGGPHTRDDTAIVVVNRAWDREETPHKVLKALQLEASFEDGRIERVKGLPSVELFRVTK